MQRAAFGGGAVNGLKRQTEAGAVRSARQRHAEVGGQVIPELVRIVGDAMAQRFGGRKVGLEPERFRRAQEAEDAPFVLGEPLPRHRAQQQRRDRIERPGRPERLGEVGNVGRSPFCNRLCNGQSCGGRAFRARVAAHGASKQRNALICARQKRDVLIAALDLDPLVARILLGFRRVLLERLVENADDDEPAFAARTPFRQVLQQVNVGAI